MATFNSKTYASILTDMENWIIANQDVITDFNEGSVITSFCEAVAQEVEQVYIRTKIGFIKYLPDLPFYAFGFSKLEGIKSSGSVIFSRNVVTPDPVTIPIGTLMSTSSGLIFVTTSVGTIPGSSTDSNSVSIEADAVGFTYNVPADTIIVVYVPVIGVDTVNNANPTTGGEDAESDNAFKTRFNNYILGLGQANVYGLITGAKTIPAVNSVSVIEHFPPESGYFNVSLYVEDGTGEASTALRTQVLSVLEGDGTEANPGYKAAGINIRVLSPTKVTVNVDIDIYQEENYSQEELKPLIEDNITGYINNLELEEDVVINRIRDVVMDVVGVYDLTLNAPSSNVAIGSEQIAKLGTITINWVS